MRMGVIDVGSNTVHLLVVDAHWGAHPIPARSHKMELRLSEHVTDEGCISAEGAQELERFVRECQEMAEDLGIETLLAFATSAIREAPNGDDVLQQVFASTGVMLHVLPGQDESRLTFLAARRWFGWSAGRIQLFDIGGGSLEIATGIDENPDVALSLPLGAGRLSRTLLPGDPPDAETIRSARKHIRTTIARTVRDVAKVGSPDIVVGTSKTIRTLARMTGAAPSGEGSYVRRVLRREQLKDMLPDLGRMSASKRTQLPGVSATRAHQILAGAMVIEATMDLFDVEELVVCPWALREGVILQRLDVMPTDTAIESSTWLTSPIPH